MFMSHISIFRLCSCSISINIYLFPSFFPLLPKDGDVMFTSFTMRYFVMIQNKQEETEIQRCRHSNNIIAVPSDPTHLCDCVVCVSCVCVCDCVTCVTVSYVCDCVMCVSVSYVCGCVMCVCVTVSCV